MDDRYIELAKHFIELNNPKRALVELAKVNQFSFDYWYLRARAYYKLERFEETKKTLLIALADAPDDLQLLYLLTQTERQLKNYKAAEVHIRKLIGLYPEHASVRELYAIVMMKLNKKGSMKKAFAEAKRLRGEKQNNLLNATTEMMKGNLSKAIDNIELALIDSPEDPLTNSLAAKYYQQNWQYGKALRFAINALRLEPADINYQNHVRQLEVLNNPIHKPFGQIIYFNKKHKNIFLLTILAIFLIIFIIGLFINNQKLSSIALSLILIAVNIIGIFAVYGFLSFIFAKIYHSIKNPRL